MPAMEKEYVMEGAAWEFVHRKHQSVWFFSAVSGI